MKKVYYYCMGTCFMPSKDKAELKKIEITGCRIDIESGKIEYTYCDADGLLHDISEDEMGKLYGSEDDFRAGRSIAFSELYIESIAQKAGNFGLSYAHDADDGSRYALSGYMFKGGDARYVVFDPCTITIGRDFNISVEIPDLGGEVYPSREECLAWNDYDVVTGAGTKKVRGWKKRLMLTDEQKEAVKAFEEAGERMKELGVALLYSDGDYAIPINSSEIADFSDEGEGRRVYDRDFYDIFKPVTVLPNSLRWYDGDVYLRFKDEESHENADS